MLAASSGCTITILCVLFPLNTRRCSPIRVQTTLFAFCFGNELFFVSLYLIKWIHAPIGLDGVLSSLTWPQVLALLCFPICLGKNIINVVQLWKASKILVGVDLAEREQARLEARMKQES
jgi:hypothetical protein